MTAWQAVACATGMLAAYAVEQNLPQAHPGVDPVALMQMSAGGDVQERAATWLDPLPAPQAMAESDSMTTAAAQGAPEGDDRHSTALDHR